MYVIEIVDADGVLRGVLSTHALGLRYASDVRMIAEEVLTCACTGWSATIRDEIAVEKVMRIYIDMFLEQQVELLKLLQDENEKGNK
ncbi:hypothetical protein LCGC14_2749190 [marine sediment metagenome]|uniref:Uncharacterized protein n=1 Tax=marine sediment metagenome TaxID=412755 RepID=A0A0F8Z263_9ZZZZ